MQEHKNEEILQESNSTNQMSLRISDGEWDEPSQHTK